MREELDKLLCKRYPAIFAERNGSPMETCMCRGFTHGDGWFVIVDELCGTIQRYLDHMNRTNPTVTQVVATQVKEKFGGLRFYYSGGDEFVRGAVAFAGALSQRTCEECGATTDVGQTHRGWIQTLCRKCVTAFKELEKAEWRPLDAEEE